MRKNINPSFIIPLSMGLKQVQPLFPSDIPDEINSVNTQIKERSSTKLTARSISGSPAGNDVEAKIEIDVTQTSDSSRSNDFPGSPMNRHEPVHEALHEDQTSAV